MADEELIQRLILRYNSLSKGNLKYSVRLIELITVVPTTLTIWRTYGLGSTLRYLAGLITALIVQRVFLSAMIRKIGPEQSSLADTLTLSRAATGAVLAGLVASGIRDRNGTAGWIGWLMPLFGVTDWLDGPLARRAGPTYLRGVLDIEAEFVAYTLVRRRSSSLGEYATLVSTPSNHTLFGTHASFDARQTSSR